MEDKIKKKRKKYADALSKQTFGRKRLDGASINKAKTRHWQKSHCLHELILHTTHSIITQVVRKTVEIGQSNHC